MAHVIGEACLGEVYAACVDVCPVQCIYEIIGDKLIGKDEYGETENIQEPHSQVKFLYGDRMLYIHPDECTSCTACMPVCPVDAIYPEDDVPENLREYVDVNRFIFAETST